MVKANCSFNGYQYELAKIHTWVGVADIKASVTQCFDDFHTLP